MSAAPNDDYRTLPMPPADLHQHMHRVLATDEAISWWWTHPIYKLADRSPAEAWDGGDWEDVWAVAIGYTSRDCEAFS